MTAGCIQPGPLGTKEKRDIADTGRLRKSGAAKNRTVGFWGLTEPINILHLPQKQKELVSGFKAKYPPSSQHHSTPLYLAGSQAWGLGHWLEACFPGHSGHPPETQSASPRGQEGAGRTAQALTQSGAHCLQAKGTGQSRGACAFRPQPHPLPKVQNEVRNQKSRIKFTPVRQHKVQFAGERWNYFILNE